MGKNQGRSTSANAVALHGDFMHPRGRMVDHLTVTNRLARLVRSPDAGLDATMLLFLSSFPEGVGLSQVFRRFGAIDGQAFFRRMVALGNVTEYEGLLYGISDQGLAVLRKERAL